jgi:predicted ATPase/DNA-binding SARP family transcriptional activator
MSQRSAVARPALHGHLPVPLTPILGRQRELQEVAELLARTRLLTLTGAGGSGKTRLALELAHRDERDVAWIDLAPVTDPSLVPQQILAAIELHEPPARDVMPAVLEALRDREMLLVFDNCEHLVDRVAADVQAILASCASISVLATTREALGITGETTWLVPPLEQQDALQLFAERARAVLPIFAIEPHNAEDVARICARLDGIPLAIELAAARAKVLSIRQIAERLNDAFSLLASGSRTLPRHRTLRATIDWSWRLISPEEQTVFRRLAVFAGTFSLDAAGAVCGDSSSDSPILDVLQSLVDKSLVIAERSAGKARYRLLETVRQFAAEKLSEAGEREAIAERHAYVYLAMAQEAEPRLFAGANDPAAMERIDDDIANLRAVFDWDRAAPELELRLVYALHWYWFARGRFHEARTRITRALARGGEVDPLVRARALVAAGHAAVWQGDWGALRPGADEAVAALRGTDDPRALGGALMLLGTALSFHENDAAEAKRIFGEAVEVARRHGGVALALTLYWTGLAAQLRGDFRAARAAFEEAHQIGVAHGSIPATAHPLTVLGWLEIAEDRRGAAMDAFRRALELHASIDDRWGLTQVVEGVAFLAADATVGVTLLAAAEAAWMQLGARPGRAPEFAARRDALMKRALNDEQLRRSVATGAAMCYEEMVALARTAAMDTTPGARVVSSAPGLRVRALGTVEILRGRTAVDAGRGRELLLYLLCNPRGATKEQIGAALWPDAEPAKVRNNFHVTLHRLRKAVGDCVVLKGDVYSAAGDIDFDAGRFMRDPQRNLDLYRGDFFESGAGEWIEETRERLREQFAAALVTLGRERIAAGDFTAAAQHYQRLTELDPFDEQAHRQLMTCHGRLGDPAAATRVYRRLADTLRRELGTEPDPATTRIFEKIVNGVTG